MANNRKCMACSGGYSYCPHCAKDSYKPKWMKNFDKEICKDVFSAVSAYNAGLSDEDEIKKVIAKYNIRDYSQFNTSIEKTFKKVMGFKQNIVGANEPQAKIENGNKDEINKSSFKTI